MKLETFFEKFELFAEAPNAVPKLRELILQLAVTGRLVEQEPVEGDAAELLRHLSSQRKELVANKKIKFRSSFPVGEDNEPFPVPSHWIWARLSDVGYEIGQKIPDKIFTYVDVSSIDALKGRISQDVQSLEPSKAPSRARKLVAEGTVIYSTVRPYLLNVAVIERRYDPEPIASTAFGILHPFDGICSKFLFYWLRSPLFTAYVTNEMKGMAYPAINDEKFYGGYVPVPPSGEQKRIVSAVDKLMAWCDQLEAQQKERDERQGELSRSALARFAAEPSVENLEFLFHPAYSVSPAEMRKAILDLAVRGKLVRQEEASSVVSLGSLLADGSLNGVSKGPTNDTSATEILRISAGTSRKDFYVDEDDFKHVDLSPGEIEIFQLLPGDLLACRFNGNLHYVGRFSLYRGLSGRVQVNPDKLIRFRLDTSLYNPRYVCHAMNAPSTRRDIEAMCATTAGNIGLSAGKLKTLCIPVPSLSEQQGIAARADEMMAIIDQLEAQLTASRQQATELMEALVAELTAAG